VTSDPVQLPSLPKRQLDGHKGTFGTVCVFGGSARGLHTSGEAFMLGAPCLSALAALRCGTGLVKLVLPGPLLAGGLSMCPSATAIGLRVDTGGDIIPHEAARVVDEVMPQAASAVVGPGLGTSEGASALVLRCIQQESASIVLDADGLNCVAAIPEVFRDLHASAVLTPHPGEFKRLCEGLGLKNHLGIDRSRADACTQLAQRLGRVIVLKGLGTVVSDGMRTWVCEAGHPCLATAGTGDVLSGVIASLIGQFCPSALSMLAIAKVPSLPRDPSRPLDLFQAACLGVLAHARAGEAWAKKRGVSGGLLASELADEMPGQIELLRVNTNA
jgi:NAD(P)H-hydrate epimerase